MLISSFTPGVYVKEVPSGLAPIAGVGTSTAGFIGIIDLAAKQDKDSKATPDTTQQNLFKRGQFIPNPDEDNYSVLLKDQKAAEEVEKVEKLKSVKAGEVELCTNFTEFTKYFGDFSNNFGQNILAHAVYGFFRNGGTRCFVTWVSDDQVGQALVNVLEKFETIDEIAIVAAPGVTNKDHLGFIVDHCCTLGDRFAILDIGKDILPSDTQKLRPNSTELLGNSDYAAVYYPWIEVYDPVEKRKFVPPSGHIAGVYARVDDRRGVHKAPANEPILGAVGLKQDISKAKQSPLNEVGINCIRNLNGNIRIWGARTLGAGKDNPDFKYINIRRQFNYLRESIDEGTQWVVFEPNNAELWAKIRRNITAFLTNEWRKGALFGTTPQEAFFVKCDAENNPEESRKLGQVVTDIGVAVIEPAEFVIFRLSQLVEEKK